MSDKVKPISFLKAHAAEVLRTVAAEKEPFIITQNGEAKVVLQDIDSYEKTQETLAMLKILALGNNQIEEGKIKESSEVFGNIYKRHEER